MENPAISVFEHVPIGVHGSIELLGLALLGISIAMQMRWLGWRTFIKHKRSMVKLFSVVFRSLKNILIYIIHMSCIIYLHINYPQSVTWIMMVLEALAVLARNTTHFRVTRSLRPIFLVDNRYLGGVRRLLRQILQSLPPILEVLALLLFTLLIFAVFGFYLFSSNEKDPYFETFYHACISLYVLLTTANYPDVMMPAYANNKWSALFFIAYLSITLYFITNLMLAIVFVEFSNIEKEKFRKLLLHKREACQHAFQLLITNSHPNRVTYKNFQGLMHHYKPKASRKYVYLLFKVLNRSKSGFLNLKEFYGFYDALEFRWYHAKEKNPWFAEVWEPFNTICHLNLKCCDRYQCPHFIVYIVEIFLKLFAYGLEDYFASGWNVFDFLVTAASVGGILAQNFGTAFFYVVILRPLRVLYGKAKIFLTEYLKILKIRCFACFEFDSVTEIFSRPLPFFYQELVQL
ncbi:Two pore calcium channel protein 1 [Armadillidium nasatum]|uniref:Two pore calcium channel protein 1 n=1 Tax=Armadillidium nasatum TaxID=96803 RepID=A0A5N5TPV3_9CRUS|nr:Two pore calcium channel protein 1 [Armadillidium nasatum]